MRVLLVAAVVLSASPAFAQQQAVSRGDAAAFALFELNKAYSIGAEAMGFCQKGKGELGAELDNARAEIKKLKAEKEFANKSKADDKVEDK